MAKRVLVDCLHHTMGHQTAEQALRGLKKSDARKYTLRYDDGTTVVIDNLARLARENGEPVNARYQWELYTLGGVYQFRTRVAVGKWLDANMPTVSKLDTIYWVILESDD